MYRVFLGLCTFPNGVDADNGWIHVPTVQTWCFNPYAILTYYDCCRNVDLNGRTSMHHHCFDGDHTFERCCSYRYGPVIRGLPYAGTLPPIGWAALDVGSVGRVTLRLAGQSCDNCIDGGQSGDGAHQIWPTSWYTARLIVDLFRSDVDLRILDSWPDLRDRLSRLEALRSARRTTSLKVLDLGCGVGLASVAAARAGHNVTAVDLDMGALQLTLRNAQLNACHVQVVRWSFTDFELSPAVAALGPFDIAMVETGPILVRAMASVQDGTEPDFGKLNQRFSNVFRHLIDLGVQIAIFPGGYRADHEGPDAYTSPWMHGMVNFARGTDLRLQGCEPDFVDDEACLRRPSLSPPGWLEALSLGPPMRHAVIIW